MDWKKLKTLFPQDELAFIMKHGASLHDKEQQLAFMEMLRNMKKADPNYSIWSSFPRTSGEEICREILAKLSKFKPQAKRASPLERSMFQRLLGELILQGFHKGKEEKLAEDEMPK